MPSTFRPTLPAFGLAALLVAAPTAAVFAETAPPSFRNWIPAQASPAQSKPPTTAATEFNDDELKSFASASLQVEEIGSKWLPRIKDAGDKSAEEEVREQAMGEMVQAVQREGLSVDRYNQIALAVQSDPDVARTVQTYRTGRR